MSASRGDRLFVVAAHPDDDVIGCGGRMSHCMRAGGAVSVAYLTDGSRSHPDSRLYDANAIRRLREDEARQALLVFGITTEPAFFRFPDGRLRSLEAGRRADAVERLCALIREFMPDLVLAPWRRDPHTDHIAASEIARDAFLESGSRAAFGGYEVWLSINGTALDRPRPGEVDTETIQLDAIAVSQKRRAILAHRSQTTDLIDDDAAGFRIDAALLDRWITGVERIHFPRDPDADELR